MVVMETSTVATQKLRPVPLDELAPQIVARVRAVCEPERVIVFGSYARGEAGPDSDVDILVVADGGEYRDTLDRLYAGLRGLPVSTDVVLVNPADLARYGNSVGLVYRPALREGIVIYQRKGAPRWDKVSTGVREDGLRYDGEVPLDSPEYWLQQAREDLEVADLVIGRLPGAASQICFHAQQCAEKAVKALLVALAVDFPRTHKLEELLPLVVAAGMPVPPHLWEASELTKHAVETRYPPKAAAVTQADAARAVAVARSVLAWAEECIGGLAKPDR